MNKLLYLSLIVFVLLLLAVSQGLGFNRLDEYIRIGVQNLWGDLLNKWVIAITDFGAEISVVLSLVSVIIYFSWRKQLVYIWFYLTGLFGAIVLFGLFKGLVGRLRPASMMVVEEAMSFPSGHATIATVLAWFVYLALDSRTQLQGTKKYIIVTLCILYPILMSFTRVYLNVHYLSDVIAGMALGTFWMIFLSKFYIKYETQIPTA